MKCVAYWVLSLHLAAACMVAGFVGAFLGCHYYVATTELRIA